MHFLKIFILTTLLFFTFDVLADSYNLSHAAYSVYKNFTDSVFEYIYNSYFYAIALILLLTFVLDFNYYLNNRLKFKLLRITTCLAISSILFCTYVRFTY